MPEKTHIPKLRVVISNHVEIEVNKFKDLELTLINIDSRPCSSVYILPRQFECQRGRVIFLPFGFRFKEAGHYLVFENGSGGECTLPKRFFHYVEDALTHQVLWHDTQDQTGR